MPQLGCAYPLCARVRAPVATYYHPSQWRGAYQLLAQLCLVIVAASSALAPLPSSGTTLYVFADVQ